jgi:Leucine-rich repeat (LRR) protein
MDCPKLTALHLTFSDGSQVVPADSNQLPDAALSALLQRLPELMSLTLANNAVTDAGLAQLSCLQKLQHCALACEQVTPSVLTNLSSSSLTSLTLVSGEGVLQERDLPAAGWPHLKLFRVNDHAMQPAVVARLTALEQLHLNRCDLAAIPNTVSGCRVQG